MMNEDYLWDKTGEDPEIEKLENALAVFRYKEAAPPALPAKVLPFKQKDAPRSFVRYAFAVAACAALVFVSVGIWFQLSADKTELAGEFSGTIAPQTIIQTPMARVVEEIEAPQQIVRRQFIKVRKPAPVIPAATKTFARRNKKDSSDALTEEEKYAYNQLMLALSITSSKLKLVSDKIEGTEKQNSVNTDGK